MRWPFQKTDARPLWDHKKAAKLAGSTVLVGLTLDEPAGPRLEQFYGTVISAHPDEGVSLRLEGSRAGETCTLPPDLRAFLPAKPGSYRLRETGEVVIDPDYTTTWDVTPPRH